MGQVLLRLLEDLRLRRCLSLAPWPSLEEGLRRE
jgi:hypothetical protein